MPSTRYACRVPTGKMEVLRAVKMEVKSTTCYYTTGAELPLLFKDENHAWALCCSIAALCGKKHEVVAMVVVP